jgi:hypothetical protein
MAEVARASMSLFSPLFFINKPFARDGWLNTDANIMHFWKNKNNQIYCKKNSNIS